MKSKDDRFNTALHVILIDSVQGYTGFYCKKKEEDTVKGILIGLRRKPFLFQKHMSSPDHLECEENANELLATKKRRKKPK